MEIDIVVKEGELLSSWWTEELDEILEALGVPPDDVNRNPYCG